MARRGEREWMHDAVFWFLDLRVVVLCSSDTVRPRAMAVEVVEQAEADDNDERNTPDNAAHDGANVALDWCGEEKNVYIWMSAQRLVDERWRL